VFSVGSVAPALAVDEQPSAVAKSCQCSPDGFLKVYRAGFGTFENAAAASFHLGAEGVVPRTEILGVYNSTQIAKYGNLDLATIFAKNVGQPPLLTTTRTTFSATSMSSPELARLAGRIRPGMLLMTHETPAKLAVVTSVNGDTCHVDSWRELRSGAAVTPAAGTAVDVSPSTRLWAANMVVAVPADASATSAVGLETMLNLSKPGTGAASQVYKAINNNLIGERVETAYETVGLYSHGVRVKEGATQGVTVENAAARGYFSIQDGEAYPNAVAFLATRVNGRKKGPQVGARMEYADVAFSAGDSLSRAFQVTKGGVEVGSIDSSGNVAAASVYSAGGFHFAPGAKGDSTGTPGSAKLDTPAGRSSIPAGATSVTISNKLVGPTSIVTVVLQTNDPAAFLRSVVPEAGRFTVTLTAGASRTVAFGWIVHN
jgi:hypothetical protein